LTISTSPSRKNPTRKKPNGSAIRVKKKMSRTPLSQSKRLQTLTRAMLTKSKLNKVALIQAPLPRTREVAMTTTQMDQRRKERLNRKISRVVRVRQYRKVLTRANLLVKKVRVQNKRNLHPRSQK